MIVRSILPSTSFSGRASRFAGVGAGPSGGEQTASGSTGPSNRETAAVVTAPLDPHPQFTGVAGPVVGAVRLDGRPETP